jgi:hypothetical protein
VALDACSLDNTNGKLGIGSRRELKTVAAELAAPC